MFLCFLLITLARFLHTLNSSYSVTPRLWAELHHSLVSSIMTWRRYCSHNSQLTQHKAQSGASHIVRGKHTMKFFQTRSANPWITPLRSIPPTHRFPLPYWINSLTTFSFALFPYIFIEHLFFERHPATPDPTFAIVCGTLTTHWILLLDFVFLSTYFISGHSSKNWSTLSEGGLKKEGTKCQILNFCCRVLLDPLVRLSFKGTNRFGGMMVEQQTQDRK